MPKAKKDTVTVQVSQENYNAFLEYKKKDSVLQLSNISFDYYVNVQIAYHLSEENKLHSLLSLIQPLQEVKKELLSKLEDLEEGKKNDE